MKRKKRAKKSIKSLQKTIEEHRLKRKNAEKEGNKERVNYYDKEIENLKNFLERKEKIADK